MPVAKFTSFLVKLASRCNLDCDYCYVYHHADQSWRSMPRLLSSSDRTAFAERLGTYARSASLTQCAIIFHGGEPLLAGVDAIVSFAELLRSSVPETCALDIGLQTNGLLLTDEALAALEAANVAVSLSLDGPAWVNDLHRTSRKGRSSFVRAYAALQRLQRHPKVFSGIIAVIDATVPPRELLAFFSRQNLPKLDFLLPDAHHERPPPARHTNPALYKNWLIEAFDLWLDHYPQLKIRTFEALLDACAGLPSGTDAFGLGDVSLLSVETDGTYHDLDVLKVVREGATKLVGSVRDTAIADVAGSSAILRHRTNLTLKGLCETCRSCELVAVCGGGSLPHRYGSDGYDHPSVYCDELFALITHVKRRLRRALSAPAVTAVASAPNVDLASFELAERGTQIVDTLWRSSRDFHANALNAALYDRPDLGAGAAALLALEASVIANVAVRPGTVAWRLAHERIRSGRAVSAIDGTPLAPDADYLEFLVASAAVPKRGLRIGVNDRWLRAPFGASVVFEDNAVAAKVRPLAEEALAIIARWRPALGQEVERICGDVQFVRDPAAHPDKIVSFSDNSVPGALYVSVVQSGRTIDAYDLADSLIHEHRHQKLYLLERVVPTVLSTTKRVKSPWRDDLRPPSGLLHAIFVFVELRRFWQHVLRQGPSHLRDRARNQLADTDNHLAEGLATLRDCPLTSAGAMLAAVLEYEARQGERAFAA